MKRAFKVQWMAVLRMGLFMFFMTMTSCSNNDNPINDMSEEEAPGGYWPESIDLSNFSEGYTAQDGDVLSGTLGGDMNLMIAPGATVTLCGVTIENVKKDDDNPMAGIECLGDANIILTGGKSNLVKPGHPWMPAIWIKSGYTLTISGKGELTADANIPEGNGAGIGGGSNDDGGNIVINGGIINAQGGNYGGAGIGSGAVAGYVTSCGDITINGGKVRAVSGSSFGGAAIGCGVDGKCGNITIDGNADVTAYAKMGAAGIGSGTADNFGSQCGDIIIGGSAIVEALTEGNGAGIGSGCALSRDTKCGDIIIGGSSKVKAFGGGAGIGSGCSDRAETECGNITIGGSTKVIAKCNYSVNGSSGIGCGWGSIWNGITYKCKCGAILIEGGDITAESENNAPAIGGGRLSCFQSITITSGITRVTAISMYYPIIGERLEDKGSGPVIFDGVKIEKPYYVFDDLPNLILEDFLTKIVLTPK